MRKHQSRINSLILPPGYIENKISLKNAIDKVLEDSVNQLQHERKPYFLTIHAKFSEIDVKTFEISRKATKRLPGFRTNTMVFFIDNIRGICEVVWSVPPKIGNEKIKPEFNKSGVMYLQAKQAMPS